MIRINVMSRQILNCIRMRRWVERNFEKVKAYNKARYSQHLEENRAYARTYAEAHAERHLATANAWNKANPERVKELADARHKTHPEKRPAVHRAWRETNRERCRAYELAYYKIHPDKRRAKDHRRKARKLGNGGSWTAVEWLTLKRQYGFRCVACWKTETELLALNRKLVPDHIVSLKRGGLNSICNLQPLCHGADGCNNKKGSQYRDFVTS